MSQLHFMRLQLIPQVAAAVVVAVTAACWKTQQQQQQNPAAWCGSCCSWPEACLPELSAQ
jgi:hypothetical protein